MKRTSIRFMATALMGLVVSSAAMAQGFVVEKTDGTKVYYKDSEVKRISLYEAGKEPTPEPQPTAETRSFSVTGNGMTVTFNMKLVEAGTFQMGSTTGESDEQPVHDVTLSKNYYMGETEVTQQLWYAVMGKAPTSDGSQWSATYGMGDKYPAYYISWNDCQEFVTKLNALTGQAFRLPTEAEWEFAARGGKKSGGYTYAGSNTIGNVAWYTDNSGSKNHEVATKSANELGLYDMSGNVWEWCADWYGSYPELSYPIVPAVDPVGPTSASYRVLRGGCWNNIASYCRVAYRGNSTPTNRNFNYGFRLAL